MDDITGVTALTLVLEVYCYLVPPLLSKSVNRKNGHSQEHVAVYHCSSAMSVYRPENIIQYGQVIWFNIKHYTVWPSDMVQY